MRELVTYNSWGWYFDITFEAAWKEANLNDGVEIKTRRLASTYDLNPSRQTSEEQSNSWGESLHALSNWFTFKRGDLLWLLKYKHSRKIVKMFENIHFLSKTWDCSFNIFSFVYIFPTYLKSKTKMLSQSNKNLF